MRFSILVFVAMASALPQYGSESSTIQQIISRLTIIDRGYGNRGGYGLGSAIGGIATDVSTGVGKFMIRSDYNLSKHLLTAITGTGVGGAIGGGVGGLLGGTVNGLLGGLTGGVLRTVDDVPAEN